MVRVTKTTLALEFYASASKPCNWVIAVSPIWNCRKTFFCLIELKAEINYAWNNEEEEETSSDFFRPKTFHQKCKDLLKLGKHFHFHKYPIEVFNSRGRSQHLLFFLTYEWAQ
jgi:hypothetical protein